MLAETPNVSNILNVGKKMGVIPFLKDGPVRFSVCDGKPDSGFFCSPTSRMEEEPTAAGGRGAGTFPGLFSRIRETDGFRKRFD